MIQQGLNSFFSLPHPPPEKLEMERSSAPKSIKNTSSRKRVAIPSSELLYILDDNDVTLEDRNREVKRAKVGSTAWLRGSWGSHPRHLLGLLSFSLFARVVGWSYFSSSGKVGGERGRSQ
jgi:hypothetical protein